jgi:hypothetical protein
LAIAVVGFLAVGIALLVVDSIIFSSRPRNVPSSAVMGQEKGYRVWLYCAGGDNKHSNVCTFYAAKTGEPLQTGEFVLEGQGHGVPASQLKIVSFDFSRIKLAEGVLVRR